MKTKHSLFTITLLSISLLMNVSLQSESNCNGQSCQKSNTIFASKSLGNIASTTPFDATYGSGR